MVDQEIEMLNRLRQDAAGQLKEFFRDCKIEKDNGRSKINLNPKTKEDRDKISSLLEIIGIYLWDEDGDIVLENRYDIATLRLYGIINEEDTIFDDLVNVDGVDLEYYNPYSFPLNYEPIDHRNNGINKDLPREKTDGLDDEDLIPVDKEFLRREKEFLQGGPFKVEQYPYQDISFLARTASRDFKRVGRIVINTKTNEEVSTEEQEQMIDKAKGGDRVALNNLIKIHIGLVYFVFRKLISYYPTNDPNDLIQSGAIGLSRAILKCDRRGKFSTYAVLYIEGYMRSAWRRHELIRAPDSVFSRRNTFHTIDGKSIDPEEKKNLLKTLAKNFGLQPVADMRGAYAPEGGRYEPYNDEELLENILPHEYQMQPLSPGQLFEEKEFISRSMVALDRRERLVIFYRFFYDFTLEHIGGMFNVTREMIRQIEHRALRKIRRFVFKNKIQLHFLINQPGNLPDDIKIKGIKSTIKKDDLIRLLNREISVDDFSRMYHISSLDAYRIMEDKFNLDDDVIRYYVRKKLKIKN